MVCSVPVWMLLEAVNLRMQNWYNVMAPWSFSLGMAYLILAFGTVLPGIFETMELIVGLIEKLAPGGRIVGRPFAVRSEERRVGKECSSRWVLGVCRIYTLRGHRSIT